PSPSSTTSGEQLLTGLNQVLTLEMLVLSSRRCFAMAEKICQQPVPDPESTSFGRGRVPHGIANHPFPSLVLAQAGAPTCPPHLQAESVTGPGSPEVIAEDHPAHVAELGG